MQTAMQFAKQINPCLRRDRKPIRPEGGVTSMAKINAKYELMYIIDLDIGEEQIAATVEKFKALIEANGTVTNLKKWVKESLHI